MSEPTGKALRGDRPVPKKFRGGRPRKPKPGDPNHVPHATSIRLTQEQIDFLREEGAKRGYFAYKLRNQGSVSTMIIDLVNQFHDFVHGPPKKPRKKLRLKYDR